MSAGYSILSARLCMYRNFTLRHSDSSLRGEPVFASRDARAGCGPSVSNGLQPGAAGRQLLSQRNRTANYHLAVTVCMADSAGMPGNWSDDFSLIASFPSFSMTSNSQRLW